MRFLTVHMHFLKTVATGSVLTLTLSLSNSAFGLDRARCDSSFESNHESHSVRTLLMLDFSFDIKTQQILKEKLGARSTSILAEVKSDACVDVSTRDSVYEEPTSGGVIGEERTPLARLSLQEFRDLIRGASNSAERKLDLVREYFFEPQTPSTVTLELVTEVQTVEFLSRLSQVPIVSKGRSLSISKLQVKLSSEVEVHATSFDLGEQSSESFVFTIPSALFDSALEQMKVPIKIRKEFDQASQGEFKGLILPMAYELAPSRPLKMNATSSGRILME